MKRSMENGSPKLQQLQQAMGKIDPAYLACVEEAEASTPRKAKLLPMRKLGGIALAACLAICAAAGIPALMKNAAPAAEVKQPTVLEAQDDSLVLRSPQELEQIFATAPKIEQASCGFVDADEPFTLAFPEGWTDSADRYLTAGCWGVAQQPYQKDTAPEAMFAYGPYFKLCPQENDRTQFLELLPYLEWNATLEEQLENGEFSMLDERQLPLRAVSRLETEALVFEGYGVLLDDSGLRALLKVGGDYTLTLRAGYKGTEYCSLALYFHWSEDSEAVKAQLAEKQYAALWQADSLFAQSNTTLWRLKTDRESLLRQLECSYLRAAEMLLSAAYDRSEDATVKAQIAELFPEMALEEHLTREAIEKGEAPEAYIAAYLANEYGEGYTEQYCKKALERWTVDRLSAFASEPVQSKLQRLLQTKELLLQQEENGAELYLLKLLYR